MAVSDPMLLTLPPPAKSEFSFKGPHEFVRPPSPSNQLSPKAERDHLRPLPVALPEKMSTPHRGLPPPAAMTLPDPPRIPPPMAVQFTGMPAPPPQWQGSEAEMRSWLVTKAEEEKRRQEEEKTRQESLRLEQRKIEQNMLQDSFRNGVPPQLVPMIFAGIGGGSLANVSLEWLQQYAAQLQIAQQQQQITAQAQSQSSPDTRMDTRLLGQSQQPPYATAQPATGVLTTVAPTHQGQPTAQSHYHPMSPATVPRQTSGPSSTPRSTLQSVLPRLTTNEASIQPIPSLSGQTAAQAPQEQTPSSPAIYFHHWVPPTSQAGSGNPPATPSDYTSSPKKRKAQGAHHPAPMPSTAGQHTSPSFSQISSTASTPGRRTIHGRTRSDASTRGGAAASDRPTTSSSQAESSSSRPDPESHQRRSRPQPQQRSRGGSMREDRSDSGSHSSHDVPPSGRRGGHSTASLEQGSAPVSPKPEGTVPAATLEGRRSSGLSGAAGRRPP